MPLIGTSKIATTSMDLTDRLIVLREFVAKLVSQRPNIKQLCRTPIVFGRDIVLTRFTEEIARRLM